MHSTTLGLLLTLMILLLLWLDQAHQMQKPFVVAWLHRKVQRVDITQSAFQRRKDVANLRIFLAAGGGIRIPYLQYAKAKALRDYVLYRVESSREAWH